MVYSVVGFAGKNTAGACYYVDLLHVRRILCCSLEYHPTTWMLTLAGHFSLSQQISRTVGTMYPEAEQPALGQPLVSLIGRYFGLPRLAFGTNYRLQPLRCNAAQPPTMDRPSHRDSFLKRREEKVLHVRESARIHISSRTHLHALLQVVFIFSVSWNLVFPLMK